MKSGAFLLRSLFFQSPQFHPGNFEPRCAWLGNQLAINSTHHLSGSNQFLHFPTSDLQLPPPLRFAPGSPADPGKKQSHWTLDRVLCLFVVGAAGNGLLASIPEPKISAKGYGLGWVSIDQVSAAGPARQLSGVQCAVLQVPSRQK